MSNKAKGFPLETVRPAMAEDATVSGAGLEKWTRPVLLALPASRSISSCS